MHFLQGRIKAEQRPINEQKNILISPSDGKVTAYPITQKGRFWIKHTQYSAAQLLKDERLAERYMGGLDYVIRLTVGVITGTLCGRWTKVKAAEDRGVLHTVNPSGK